MIDWSLIDGDAEGDYGVIEVVAQQLKLKEPTDFSQSNREALKQAFCGRDHKCIIEIGVENNPDVNLTSTSVFLKNKNPDTYYFGVDILDRSHLNDPSKNVYTIQHQSEDVGYIMQRINEVYTGDIDFLFIDGWHSINQCQKEWDGYVPLLSSDGTVGIHDTNYHYGPAWLIDVHINRAEWDVTSVRGNPLSDFGISFAKRKP